MTHDPMHDAETDAIEAELEKAGLVPQSPYDPPGRAVPGAVEAMATMPC